MVGGAKVAWLPPGRGRRRDPSAERVGPKNPWSLERTGLSSPVAKASVCFVLREAWLSSQADCLGVGGAERML